MSENREHKIVITKSANETIMQVKCGECKWEMADPTEFHPPAFCLLVKENINPFSLVRAATGKIPEGKGIIQLQEVHSG